MHHPRYFFIISGEPCLPSSENGNVVWSGINMALPCALSTTGKQNYVVGRGMDLSWTCPCEHRWRASPQQPFLRPGARLRFTNLFDVLLLIDFLIEKKRVLSASSSLPLVPCIVWKGAVVVNTRDFDGFCSFHNLNLYFHRLEVMEIENRCHQSIQHHRITLVTSSWCWHPILIFCSFHNLNRSFHNLEHRIFITYEHQCEVRDQ